MADGQTTYLIGPEGDIVPVAPEHAEAALRAGYTLASPNQAKDADLQRKHGSLGQQLITGAEAAADTATYGLSTMAEKALGVPAEDIAGREQANPIAHVVGTAAGIAAPLLIPGGQFSAPGLISKAGQAVTRGAEAILPEATGALGRIAAKAVATGAGSAVEGAAYGLGHVVHEAALGDPNLTAQSALATVGIAGLAGGALGGVGGLLGGLAKEATSSELGAKLSDWLGEFEGERNIKAAGAIQGDIKRATNQIGRERLNKLGQEMGGLGLVSPFSTPASTLEKAEALKESTGKGIADLLTQADAQAPEAAPSIGAVIGRAKKEILAPLESNPLEKGAASQLGQMLDGYTEKYAIPGSFGKGTLSLSELHNIRKQVSDKLYGLKGVMDPTATPLKAALKDFRGIISDEIKEGIDRAGASSAEWKQLNRTYEVASRAADFAENGIARAHGNNMVSLTEGLGTLGGGLHAGIPGGIAAGAGTALVRRHAAGVLGAAARGLRNYLDKGAVEGVVNKTADAIASERAAGMDTLAAAGTQQPEAVAALAQLERNNNAVATRIDDMASTLVRGGARAANVGRNEIAAGIGKAAGKSFEDVSADHAKRFAEISKLSGDPAQMQAALEKQSDGLHDHAPQTAQAMAIASARGIAFLASKLPPTPQLGPLAPKWQPSRTEIAKFDRYYEAVHRPMSILKQAAAGTLTPEAIEAVRTVYPELFSRMQQGIVEKLATHPEQTPYRNKLMLSMLMGQDLDGTTSPQMINANQMVMQSAPKMPKMPGAVRPTSKSLGNITLSSRFLTPGQSSANRK